MIDLWGVISNAFWILGLAVILATVSWANWKAMIALDRLHFSLAKPHIGLSMETGGLLFCVGLATSAHRWWEQSLWALLAVAFLVQISFSIRTQESRMKGEPNI